MKGISGVRAVVIKTPVITKVPVRRKALAYGKRASVIAQIIWIDAIVDVRVNAVTGLIIKPDSRRIGSCSRGDPVRGSIQIIAIALDLKASKLVDRRNDFLIS